MKTLQNNKGVALVTSLMFTMLALVITMSLLYIVTLSTRSSGAMKRYRTVTEAAYGGTDIVLKDLIKASMGYADYVKDNPTKTFTEYMTANSLGSLNSPTVSDCLYTKLTTPKNQWPSACSNVTSNIKDKNDLSFKLNAATGKPFTVYSRVVDDMGHKVSVYESGMAKVKTIAGNTDLSKGDSDASAVIEGGAVYVPHLPYIYSVEVQAESPTTPEKTKLLVQYAY